MPTYLPPINGISLSEALAEAATVAPLDRVVLHTFEIYNANITNSLRIVRNNENVIATLESDAPRDPSASVTFYAAGVEIEALQQSPDEASPRINLTITNVNGMISQLLRYSRGTFFVWEIIERVYVSDDLTAPARLPPTKLQIFSVDMDSESARLVCGYGESNKNPIPRLTFKAKEYPGLAAK